MKGTLYFTKDEVLDLIKKHVPFGNVEVDDIVLDSYSTSRHMTVEFTSVEPKEVTPPASLPVPESESENDNISF